MAGRETFDIMLAVGHPYDPDTSQVVDVFLSTDDWIGSSTDANFPNIGFEGIIVQPPNRRVSALSSDGALLAHATPEFSTMVLATPPMGLILEGEYDFLTRYEWKSREIDLYFGKDGEDSSTFSKVTVLCSDFNWKGSETVVEVSTVDQALDIDVLEDTFGGFGPCLRFDGVDDRLVGETHPNAWQLQSVSGGIRFRLNGKPADGTYTLMERGGSGGDSSKNSNYRIAMNVTDGRLEFGHQHGARVDFQFSVDMQTLAASDDYVYNGKWHTVVFSRTHVDDATGGSYVTWIDTSEQTVTVGTSTYLAAENPSAGEAGFISIGAASQGALELFPGDLDEVFVIDRAVDRAEAIRYDDGNFDFGRDLVVANYGFNEGQGTTVFDDYSQSEIGIREEWALRNLGNGWVDIPDAVGLNAGDQGFNGGITVQALINFGQLAGAANNQFVFIKPDMMQLVFNPTSLRLSASIWDGAAFQSTFIDLTDADLRIADNAMWTVVWDGLANILSLYRNDELKSSDSFTGFGSPSSTDPYTLFSNSTRTLPSIMYGMEFRVFTSALTQSEIAANYRRHADITVDPTLVCNIRMDESSGALLADQTGNGNDGTLTNLSWQHTAITFLGGGADPVFVGSGTGTGEISGLFIPEAVGKVFHIPLLEVDNSTDISATSPVYFAVENLYTGTDEKPFPETASTGAPVVYEGGNAIYDERRQPAETPPVEVVDVWDHVFGPEDYCYDPSRGFIRLKSDPLFEMTASVRASLKGGDPYGSSCAHIHERMLDRWGKRSGIIPNAASYAEHKAGDDVLGKDPESKEMGFYATVENENLLIAMSSVAASAHSFSFIDIDGEMRIVQLYDPALSPAAKYFIAADDRIRDSLEEAPIPPVSRSERVRHTRHYYVFEDPNQILISNDSGDTLSRAEWRTLLKEWRLAKAKDNAVLERHADANLKEVFSYIVNQSDAQLEADQRFSLRSVRRYNHACEVVTEAIPFFDANLADVVDIESNRNTINGTKRAIILEIEEDWQQRTVSIIAWSG